METTQFETIRHDQGGEVWEAFRCKKCFAICVAEEYSSHACPPTQLQDLEASEDLEYRTALGAVTSAATREDLKVAIHSLETVTKTMRHNRVERVSRKYTPEVLRRMVAEEIRWQAGRTQQMRNAELLINDEMRARGRPFVERMKVVNDRKIRWCDQEEARLTKLLGTFRVRPLAEWFDEVDYETAKEMGMGWIIRFKLDEIIKE